MKQNKQNCQVEQWELAEDGLHFSAVARPYHHSLKGSHRNSSPHQLRMSFQISQRFGTNCLFIFTQLRSLSSRIGGRRYVERISNFPLMIERIRLRMRCIKRLRITSTIWSALGFICFAETLTYFFFTD